MTLPIFPMNVLPNTMNINLVGNTQVFRSSFNNSVNTHGFAGSHWKATLNYTSLDNFSVREIDILQTFIWDLGGANGRFMMPNFSKLGSPPRGTPKVNGSNQSGGTLITDGWIPNSLVLMRGDMFQVGNELKMVKEDIKSDSAGNATLRFFPWLRDKPTDNAEIITDRPMGMFMLEDDNQGDFQLSAGLQGQTSIQVIEAFYV